MSLNIEPINIRPAFGENKTTAEKTPTPEKENKKSSSTAYWIGAGAVAASVIAGIIIHKQLKVKPPKIDGPGHQTLVSNINNIEKMFDREPLDTKLKELEQIVDEKQKAGKLSDFLSDLSLGQTYFSGGTTDFPRGMKELPETVQEAIKNKDFETAIKEFKKAVNELPPAYKSIDAGNTIAESVENVFGEKSGIVPHTYDIKQENPRIHVYKNNGGYKDGIVNSQNEIYYNDGELVPKEVQAEAPAVAKKPNKNKFKDVYIDPNKQYCGYMSKSDRRVVRLDVPAEVDGLYVTISLLSPDSRYTPAQNDLIKLIENGLNEEQIATFRKLTDGFEDGERDGKVNSSIKRKFTALNYDAILSAIQTFANKV